MCSSAVSVSILQVVLYETTKYKIGHGPSLLGIQRLIHLDIIFVMYRSTSQKETKSNNLIGVIQFYL